MTPAHAQDVTYQYDALGRLIKMEEATGEIVDYAYDPAGNRTSVQSTIPNAQVDIDDAAEYEGTDIIFTVTRSRNLANAISVDYATSLDGSADSVDLVTATGTLSFAADETSKTITVTTNHDTYNETDETFSLVLSNPGPNVLIGDGTGAGIISDNDSPPEYSVSAVSVSEGGSLSFTVAKSGDLPTAHQVSYATSDGTAIAGTDYTGKSGVLTFATGEMSKTVSVATTDDAVFEDNKTLTFTLSAPSAGTSIKSGEGVASGTITNNDAIPSFTVSNASVAEGGALVFTVTKTGASSKTHNINYATSNHTAASSDYTSRSGTMSFGAGQTSKGVRVYTTQDIYHEHNDAVKLTLSAVTNGATISDSFGYGYILNDDTPPAFAINNAPYVSEGGTSTWTVTKTGSTLLPINVNYATQTTGTATSGVDYTAKSGVLKFAWNQTSKTFTVPTIEETLYERNESYYAKLSKPTYGATLADYSGYTYILNDDPLIYYVRNSGGALQAGYTETVSYNWRLGFIHRTKVGTTTIHMAVEATDGPGFCTTSIAPISGYSWTGNGCEMRVD